MSRRSEAERTRWATSDPMAVAVEVAGDPGMFKPSPVPRPPAMLMAVARQRVDMPVSQLPDDIKVAAGEYLKKVTEAEQRNAARLEVVLNAIATLASCEGDEVATAGAAELREWCRRYYPRLWQLLKGRPIPESRHERGRVARAACRDENACPAVWRGVRKRIG